MLQLLASLLQAAWLVPLPCSCHVGYCVHGFSYGLTATVGPFELVKNLTQNSEIKNASSMSDPVRDSYSKKGSIKTAMNVVKHRGYLGLWSGFRLHLR